MGLRCDPNEVAIYLPPQAVTSLPAGEALEQCRAFLGDLVEGPPPDVRVFDDRAAKVTLTRGAFFDDIQGATPALDALEDLSATGSLRVVLTAEVGKLYTVSRRTRWLDDDVQVIEAARALSQRPDAATLAALKDADAAAWARIFQPLVRRRMHAPGGRRSNVGAPAPLVAAFLEVNTFEGWCRAASRIAEVALPEQDEHMCQQAIRHFEKWLEDGIEAMPRKPKAKRGKTPKTTESAYWEHLAEGRRALEDGRWDDVTEAAVAAERVGSKLPPEVAGMGTAVGRLKVAAQLGRLQFADALKELENQCRIDALVSALLSPPWSPTEPLAIAVGLSKRESALRYVAWLCTRIASRDEEEWRLALDRLERQLEPAEAESLRAARARKKKPKAKR